MSYQVRKKDMEELVIVVSEGRWSEKVARGLCMGRIIRWRQGHLGQWKFLYDSVMVDVSFYICPMRALKSTMNFG
jgi:hypothetical protein